jgi:hypothetical protein
VQFAVEVRVRARQAGRHVAAEGHRNGEIDDLPDGGAGAIAGYIGGVGVERVNRASTNRGAEQT